MGFGLFSGTDFLDGTLYPLWTMNANIVPKGPSCHDGHSIIAYSTQKFLVLNKTKYWRKILHFPLKYSQKKNVKNIIDNKNQTDAMQTTNFISGRRLQKAISAH